MVQNIFHAGTGWPVASVTVRLTQMAGTANVHSVAATPPHRPDHPVSS